MNTKFTLAAGIAALALTTGLAATAASAAITTTSSAAGTVKPHTVSPHATGAQILGSYTWNSDGFTGTLVINSVTNGVVVATLTDYGLTETLSGTWDGNTNILDLTRPKQRGSGVQQYYYVLGGFPNEALPTMFGGYFTDTNTGSFEYGTYLQAAN
jgi:hypothetical protein